MVVALAAVISQVLGLAHMGLISHQRCEQGAVIHASASTSAHAHAADDRKVDDGVAVRAGGALEGDHEHCDPFAVAPALVAAEPWCADLTLLDGTVLPWSVRPSAGERAVALLLLAPKSSPPTV